MTTSLDFRTSNATHLFMTNTSFPELGSFTVNKFGNISTQGYYNVLPTTKLSSVQTPKTAANALQTVALKYTFLGVGILELINNLVVMVVVLRMRNMRRQLRKWFIFHQSVADLISAIYIIALVMRPAVTSFQGLSGYLTCALWTSNFTYNASSLASSYILAAFTVEVYMAIVHPVRHKNVFSQKVVIILVAIAWIIGIAYPLGTYVGLTQIIGGICYPSYGWMFIAMPMSILNVIVKMVIPMTLYATFYAMTLVFLRRKANVASSKVHSTLTTMTSKQAQASKKSHYSRASHNVAVTVLCTLIIHVIAWAGNQVLIIMMAVGISIDTSGLIYQIFLLAIFSNSCVNPVIYAIKYRQFRRALKRMLLRPRLMLKQKSATNVLSLRIAAEPAGTT